MVQVQGTVAPSHLLILLLLVALQAREAWAAPWRARGLGRWQARTGTQPWAAWSGAQRTLGW